MAQVNFEFHIDSKGVDHKTLFVDQIKAKAPLYEKNVHDILAKGLIIDAMEFYSYALFEDFNPNNPFSNSFRGFSDTAHIRKAELDRIYIVDQTIGFRYPGNTKTQIMYAGCGMSLVAANKIFNLTNADYIKIAEKPGRPSKTAIPGENRTLDFEYWGSDSERLFRVECKGKEGLDGDLNKKINHIISKKIAQPAGLRDFCFGIISALPVEPDNRVAKCYFVDPDMPDAEIDPMNFRLSARLRYYADRLSNLGNSKWVKAIKQLFYNSNSRLFESQMIISNYPDVDMSLREFIGIKNIRPLTNGYNFKCTVIEANGQKIIGRLTKVTDKSYFFFGFIDSLFETIENETIGTFLKYKSETSSIDWNDVMYVWDGYLDKDEIFLTGELIVNSTGEVSGILNQNMEHNQQ